MYVGAAVSTVSLVISLVNISGTKAAIKKAHPSLTAAQVNQLQHVIIAVAVVSGVIGAALWLWMARANSQGRNWARITSSVLFALATVDMFGVLSSRVGARPGVRGADLGRRAGRDHLALAPGIDRVLQAAAARVSPAPVVLAAVPTLFSAEGELDRDANRALYKLIAGLLDGLLVAGTTGEFPALEDAERLWLVEQALAEAGPDRVIAHIGAPDARHAARLARAAVALGAGRIAAITPYYLPARPDELVAHYRRVREAAPGAELYAYIFPERTGLRVPAPLLAEVAEAAGLAGAKISGSASADLAGYVAAAPGLRIFSGNDADPWAAMRAGGAGVISGRSSRLPRGLRGPAAGSGAAGEAGPDRRAGGEHRPDQARAAGARAGRQPGRPDDRRSAGPGAGRRDRGDGGRSAAAAGMPATMSPPSPVRYLAAGEPGAGVARRLV